MLPNQIFADMGQGCVVSGLGDAKHVNIPVDAHLLETFQVLIYLIVDDCCGHPLSLHLWKLLITAVGLAEVYLVLKVEICGHLVYIIVNTIVAKVIHGRLKRIHYMHNIFFVRNFPV